MEIRLRHRKGRKVEYLDNGKWKTTGKDNKRDAKLWVETRGYESPDIKFSDFAKDIFSDNSDGSYMSIRKNVGNDLANITWSNYENLLNLYVMPFFKDYRLKDISPRTVQTWYITLKKKNGKPFAPKTKDSALSVLSIILDHAIFCGLIQTNSCRSVIRSKPKAVNEKKAFTDEELSRLFPEDIISLISVWESLENACYFMIMRDTGWRPGEVAAIKPSSLIVPELGGIYIEGSIDPKNIELKDTIKTSDKGYEYKIGMLNPFTLSIFNRICERKDPDNLIFTSYKGKALSSQCAYKRFVKAMMRAGVDTEKHPPYSLRVTFFTRTTMTETDTVAMKLMGHTQWHSCYDKRTPEELIRKAYSELSNEYRREKLDSDIVRREG